MKTPLTYYGGKGRLAPKILELMPPHSCYTEPFAGGLAVMFQKGHPDCSASDYREVVNDRDEAIVNLWREMQDPNSEFHHRIKYTPYSKAEHAKAKQEVSAWAAFVIRAQSFSHDPTGAWSRCTLLHSPSANSRPASFAEQVARLPEVIERLRCVIIEQDDACNFVSRWDSPFTLHYCDPPYPGAKLDAYEGEYTLQDLQGLVDVLAGCKGSIMLSNYDQPDLVVPDDWVRHEFKTVTNVSHSSQNADIERTEVLWVCDRSSTVDSVHHKKMWSPKLGYDWSTQLSTQAPLF